MIEQQKIRLSSDLHFLFILLIALLAIVIVLKNSYSSLLIIPSVLIILFIRKQIILASIISNITIERKISKLTTMEGGEIEITLNIKNDSSNKTQLMELVDSLPDSFELIEGTNIFLFDLIGNESITLKYRVRANEIGIFEFGNIFIKQSEFFGFMINSFYYTFTESEQIIVSPRFERLEKLPVYSLWMKFFSGIFVSKRFGQDSDFKGLRDYQFGDKLQHINWKASSRYQNSRDHKLISNAFSFDNIIEFNLIMDLTFESYLTHIEILRVTATLVEYLLRTKNKVGLILANEYPTYIKGKIGLQQYKIIMNKLLTTKPDETVNTSFIVDRLINFSKSFSKRSINLLITPTLNDYMTLYAHQMRQIGYNILIIQPDAVNKQLTAISNDDKLMDLSKSVVLFYNIAVFDILYNKMIMNDKIKNDNIPLLPWNLEKKIDSIFYKKVILNK